MAPSNTAKQRSASSHRQRSSLSTSAQTAAAGLLPKPRAKKGSTDPAIAYFCEFPGCRKAFGREHDVKRHAVDHSPDPRPFKCNLDGCRQDFSQLDGLRQHQRSGQHFNKRDYKCRWPGAQCERAFNDRSARTRHYRFVHGPEKYLRYYCPFDCGAHYKRPGNISGHCQKKHPDAGYDMPEPEPLRGEYLGDISTQENSANMEVDRDESGSSLADDAQGGQKSQAASASRVLTQNTNPATHFPIRQTSDHWSRALSDQSPSPSSSPAPIPSVSTAQQQRATEESNQTDLYSHAYTGPLKTLETDPQAPLVSDDMPFAWVPRLESFYETGSIPSSPQPTKAETRKRWSLSWILSTDEDIE
ncbi:hypothetical protein SISNIDRAFT_549275 [Sistotremastrum niveocremeum HHB9708]|uniref:C2H2-type domain-containing protein n=1 Tax=Sistotremastrum niveocremeum HHB9708 TaxID=1314777 RepID=A0A164VCK9_9AGAM|nr:hypothetical protein SISNIDRAFT_549275 [Sistotremastrum niveocremeum HHB9708]